VIDHKWWEKYYAKVALSLGLIGALYYFVFAPRGIPHAYVVHSERARMLVTISPSGTEQLFVSLGVPVTGAEPPTDAVMPPMPELARLFAAHGTEILGPPPSFDALS